MLLYDLNQLALSSASTISTLNPVLNTTASLKASSMFEITIDVNGVEYVRADPDKKDSNFMGSLQCGRLFIDQLTNT